MPDNPKDPPASPPVPATAPVQTTPLAVAPPPRPSFLLALLRALGAWNT
jgi:hypothetical protein